MYRSAQTKRLAGRSELSEASMRRFLETSSQSQTHSIGFLASPVTFSRGELASRRLPLRAGRPGRSKHGDVIPLNRRYDARMQKCRARKTTPISVIFVLCVCGCVCFHNPQVSPCVITNQPALDSRILPVHPLLITYSCHLSLALSLALSLSLSLSLSFFRHTAYTLSGSGS